MHTFSSPCSCMPLLSQCLCVWQTGLCTSCRSKEWLSAMLGFIAAVPQPLEHFATAQGNEDASAKMLGMPLKVITFTSITKNGHELPRGMLPSPDLWKCPVGSMFLMLSVQMSSLSRLAHPLSHDNLTGSSAAAPWRFLPLVVNCQHPILQDPSTTAFAHVPTSIREVWKENVGKAMSNPAPYRQMYQQTILGFEALNLSDHHDTGHVMHLVRMLSVWAAELSATSNRELQRIRGDWVRQTIFDKIYSTGFNIESSRRCSRR